MELNLHDFGEGIGVDMRDFPSHSGDEGDEGMVGGIVGTLDEAQNGTRVHPNRESSRGWKASASQQLTLSITSYP
jgi:hypothetical protein